MKICYFADAESIHVIRWCKHFASLGHEVHLISFKNAQIENVTTHFISTGDIAVSGGNWKVLLQFREVKTLLKNINPDIFHAHYATSYGITGALCGFHPYIITALGSDVLISPKRSLIYRLLLKYAFSKADWITSMADHMRNAIIEMGVSPSKTDTVPFGIDPKIFNDTSRAVPEGKFVITSTRNFEPVYNIPHLINAVAMIKDQIPGLQLNMIGAGSQRKEVEALVKEKGLEDLVTFFGKVPQPEIAKTLNASHLFISVSLSDGNNISLNEAMACGAVCIATDIPANTQWIEDGKNGFLVKIDDVKELADKIVNSYSNFESIRQKAEPVNKKIIAERAIWENNMRVVEKKYKSLTEKK
ncbi:MAG TPA: glycosyltransferase family 4 protein [Bacteroidia bacterium]|jgi:glycosyltransferase involved in cell wall biosynthesis